jgi:hypothetical protein
LDAGARLTDYYVYPDGAARMIQAVQKKHEEQGDYNAIRDGDDFAAALTRDLRAVSHDQHLFVVYNPFISPGQSESSAGPHPLKASPSNADLPELLF